MDMCYIGLVCRGFYLQTIRQKKHETVKEMMRDAVMHDVNKISFLE